MRARSILLMVSGIVAGLLMLAAPPAPGAATAQLTTRPSIEEMQKLLPLESKVEYQSGSTWVPAVVKGYQSPGIIRIEVQDIGNRPYTTIAQLDRIRKPGATASIMALPAAVARGGPAPATQPAPGTATLSRPKYELPLDEIDLPLSLGFIRDGRGVLMPVPDDQGLLLWDLAVNPPILRTFPGGTREYVRVAVSPDQKRAALTEVLSRNVTLVDLSGGPQTRVLQLPRADMRYEPAWTPDSQRLVVAGARGGVVLDGTTGQVLTQLSSDLEVVTAVAVSPDGSRIAVVGTQKNDEDRLEILDSTSGKSLVAVPLEMAFWVHFLDDKTLVLPKGLLGMKLQVLDVASGKVARSFSGTPGLAESAALSPDRKWLAVAVNELGVGVQIWDAATGKVAGTLRQAQDDGYVERLAFAPDGKSLVVVVAGDHGGLRIWDVNAAGQFVAPSATVRSSPTVVRDPGTVADRPATRPSGTVASPATRPGAAPRPEEPMTIVGKYTGVMPVVMRTSSDELAAQISPPDYASPLAGLAGRVIELTGYVRDVSEIPALRGPPLVTVRVGQHPATSGVRSLASEVACDLLAGEADKTDMLSPGQKITVVGTVRRSSLQGLENVVITALGPDPALLVKAADLSREIQSNALATGAKYAGKYLLLEGLVRKVDVEGKKLIVDGPEAPPDVEIVIQLSGAALATAQTYGIGAPIRVKALFERATDLAGRRMLLRQGRILKEPPPEPKYRWQLPSPPGGLCFTGDGERLLVAAGDQQALQVLNLRTGQQEADWAVDGVRCAHLALSPDRKYIAAAGPYLASVLLLDAKSGQRVRALDFRDLAQSQRAWVAWSPDGRRLAVAAANELAVWDVASEQPQPIFRTPARAATSLSFSPGGQVIGALVDKRVHFWDLSTSAAVSVPATSSLPREVAWAVLLSPQRVLLAPVTGHLYRRDVPGGAELCWYSGGYARHDAGVVSGDQTLVAATSADGALYTWEAASGRSLSRLLFTKDNEKSVGSQLAIAPDNRLLAVALATGTVTVWELNVAGAIIRPGIPQPADLRPPVALDPSVVLPEQVPAKYVSRVGSPDDIYSVTVLELRSDGTLSFVTTVTLKGEPGTLGAALAGTRTRRATGIWTLQGVSLAVRLERDADTGQAIPANSGSMQFEVLDGSRRLHGKLVLGSGDDAITLERE
jgi:WD40 repeat protein